PAWPEPISAASFVQVATEGAIHRFPDRVDRARFVHDVASAVMSNFATADLGNPMKLAASLGPAVEGGHLRIYLSAVDEQGVVEDLGAGGAVSPLGGDSLIVANQSLAGTGAGSLHRRIRYSVDVDPGGQPAAVAGRLEVLLQNAAPDGRSGPKKAAAEGGADDVRASLTVFTPFRAGAASVDGDPVALGMSDEFGRHRYSAEVTVPSGQSRTFRTVLVGRLQLTPGGWLSIDLPRGEASSDDYAEVSVRVPSGWRIARASGIRQEGPRTAVIEIRQDRDHEVRLRLERDGLAGLWDRLWNQP
ncbi:MAG TPA: hypothetical protein VF711_14260, partial [Acidimicrobiales bacterium]